MNIYLLNYLLTYLLVTAVKQWGRSCSLVACVSLVAGRCNVCCNGS